MFLEKIVLISSGKYIKTLLMEGQSIRYFFLLLFLLHFRSGSSLTGKILSANPDNFYLYEPYHRNFFKYSNGSGAKHDLLPILTCRTCNSVTHKQSETAHNLLF